MRPAMPADATRARLAPRPGVDPHALLPAALAPVLVEISFEKARRKASASPASVCRCNLRVSRPPCRGAPPSPHRPPIRNPRSPAVLRHFASLPSDLAPGNATGISLDVPVPSILKKLKAIVEFSTLGILYSGSEADTVIQARKAQELGETMNFTAKMIDLAREKNALDLSGLDAIFMTTSCAGMRCVDDVLGLARKAGIPTAASLGGAAEKGALLTISANTREQGLAASSMVAEVLNGSRPSDIASR